MNFHWPSFLLGFGSGVATALLADRLRPVWVEIGAMAYRAFEGAGTMLERGREEVEDILAEARHRTGGTAGEAAPEPRPPRRTAPPRKRRTAAKQGPIRAAGARQ